MLQNFRQMITNRLVLLWLMALVTNHLANQVALTQPTNPTTPCKEMNIASNAHNSNSAPNTFNAQEIVNAGHKFFGETAKGLAMVVEKIAANCKPDQNGNKNCTPNAYIIGEEGAGAFFVGARYGEGCLYQKNQPPIKVFWQGASLGFDFGGRGARTMMLVYNLPRPDDIFRTFNGVNANFYFGGGLDITIFRAAISSGSITVVPTQSGIGFQAGVNLGMLKFSPQSTWIPF